MSLMALDDFIDKKSISNYVVTCYLYGFTNRICKFYITNITLILSKVNL